MKQTIAIFLLITLSWQMLFKTGYIAYWKINQIYITANFCVNKDKPIMHCNGKCHLAKQLEKVEEKKGEKSKFPTEIFKIKSVEHFLLSEHHFIYLPNYLVKRDKENRQSSPSLLLNGYFNLIDYPPEFI